MSHITLSNLSFAWPDGTPVFDGLNAVIGDGRTGLIAPNGSGKTTLLRLVTGELLPGSGTLGVPGSVGYLSQSLPLRTSGTVAELLGIDEAVRALRAIEQGDASPEHFTAVGSDWDVEERARVVLARLGLAELELDRELTGLSGGEIVTLGLAGQVLTAPEALLLDEPTNNLDRDARRRLYEVVEGWTGCLVVASHDRELLDLMDNIAELSATGIRWYGGNFTDYTEAVEHQQEVAMQAARTAELDMKRQKRELQTAKERSERRNNNARRNEGNAVFPRGVAGNRKRFAEVAAAKSTGMHQQRLADAAERFAVAATAVREEELIAIELPDTEVPEGRIVLEYQDLVVRGPERIALCGPNGSGKTTLLRAIAAHSTARYLPQRLDLLDPDASVLENLSAFAPDLSPNERRHRLAQFLFKGDRIHLAAGTLSGGELLRASIACLLCATPAPQLFLLDEPTNNLDLVSTRQLVRALTVYRGAFIVVSHDERFLAEIGVTRRIEL
ncbi:ABC-F family ATP-binding cassette domain-containing protein [Allokutzneria oryzae]|uniref:ABC-F family ATP-binding cassette domain-containing protein n=1 Tax=Allokutzneria oryzae TaxID=1378989 RepID=A0ABV5ZTQ9_9PSEU